MNKIFTLLLVGALTAGAVTANAESQIFKKKKKKAKAETIETEDGKKKKILAKYEYDLGACMFCQLCVNACPHDAITFDQNFEHAVFDRTKLVLQLNHAGSKVIEKKKEV